MADIPKQPFVQSKYTNYLIFERRKLIGGLLIVKGRGIPHFANQAIHAFLHTQPTSSARAPDELDTKSIAARAALSGSRASPVPTNTNTTTGAALPHLTAASGGNAGIAAASAARALGVPCTVFLPSSAASLVGALEREGPRGGKMDVRIGGENYQEALRRAEQFKAELGPSG